MSDVLKIILAGSFSLVVVFNYFWGRDLKNPAILHSVMWFFIIILHTFVPHGLNPLSLQVYFIVFFSVICFSSGALFGSCIGNWNILLYKKIIFKMPSKRLLNIYFYTALVGIPFLVMRAFDLASHNSTDNFLINLRMTLTDEEAPLGFGVLSYFLPIAYSAFFFRLLDRKKLLFSASTTLLALICLVYAIFNTGRTFLFLLILTSAFIIALTRPGFFTLKRIVLFLGLLLLAFVGLGLVLGKISTEGHGPLHVFWIYLLGGITAFDVIFFSPIQLHYGDYSFRSFYAVMSAFGYDFEVKPLIQEYVYMPELTNVYTVFKPYFLDFGSMFIFLSQFCFGSVHGFLYKRAIRGDAIAILLYSISIYPLFMQWFQDQYLSLASMWIIYAILFLMPFFVNKLILYREPNKLLMR